jgi:hypothetical protein
MALRAPPRAPFVKRLDRSTAPCISPLPLTDVGGVGGRAGGRTVGCGRRSRRSGTPTRRRSTFKDSPPRAVREKDTFKDNERESEATELPPRGLAGPSAEAAETRGWSPLSRQRRARCGAARAGGRAAQRLYNVLLSQAAHRDLRGRAWRARARGGRGGPVPRPEVARLFVHAPRAREPRGGGLDGGNEVLAARAAGRGRLQRSARGGGVEVGGGAGGGTSSSVANMVKAQLMRPSAETAATIPLARCSLRAARRT